MESKRNECHGQKPKDGQMDGMMEEETCGESSIRDYFLAPWPQLNLAAVAHALPTLYMHLRLDPRETSQTILSYIFA
jgi:hypothetical protein